MEFSLDISKAFLGLNYFLLAYFVWSVFRVVITAYNSSLRKIPGPSLSAFTNIPLKIAILSGRRTAYIHNLHEKYGQCLYVRIASKEVAIADIDAFRTIYRVGSDYNKGPWYQGQNPYQYNDRNSGVFCILNNKAASRRRRLFQSAGTKKVVAEWEPQVEVLTDLVIENIKSELQEFRLCDIMKWWTFLASDVTGSLAFGESFGNIQNGERNQLVHDIEGAMPLIGMRAELPWTKPIMECIPKWVPGSPMAMFNRFGSMDATLFERLELRNTKTLFSKMVLEEESKQTIPDRLIEMEAMNVIVAGTDTTAMTLVYLTYIVLRHDDVKQNLVQELKSCTTRPNWEELENLPYLNNVIQETMRLYPGVPASLPRIVPAGGENVGKYVIPAGTQVSTQAWTLQRDPTVFKEPLKFNPDRWQNPSPEMKEHMMAFGGPSRMCLGQNIARLEMLHAVSKLFHECPNICLAPNTSEESMEVVDFFAIKPKAEKCVIVSN